MFVMLCSLEGRSNAEPVPASYAERTGNEPPWKRDKRGGKRLKAKNRERFLRTREKGRTNRSFITRRFRFWRREVKCAFAC